jgi:hypothetical protein
MAHRPPALLSREEYASLLEVSRGDAQRDIPQAHWERLVALGLCSETLGSTRADGGRYPSTGGRPISMVKFLRDPTITATRAFSVSIESKRGSRFLM